ncbi:MAG: hypothetical protein ACM3X3_03450 [Betaproteobacteria bacterium]
MLRSRIHNAVIAGALAIAVALTGVVGAAFAQEATTSTEQPAVNGIAPSTPVNPHFGSPQRTGWSGPLVTRIADILKMSVEDLVAQRQAGKSFADIAQEKGMTEADLLAALVAQVKSSVESLVASGNMTQSQADRILANVEANLKAAITRTTVGPQGGGIRMGRGPAAGAAGQHGRQSAGARAGFGAERRQGARQGTKSGLGMGFGLGRGRAGCPVWQQKQNEDGSQAGTQNTGA